MKQTSESWWQATKTDDHKLVAWLYKQYRGEIGAGQRIRALRDRYALATGLPARTLTKIAAQEDRHAQWIAGLLQARGHAPEVKPAKERYWRAALESLHDLETGCAIGAHAERMRLERIEVIANDPEAPADVRAVFARILPEERFHERAFRSLASEAALAATAGAHALGRAALGLTP
ncbi:hypothetical protein DB30_07620 [Enhygromyxa salina]|uniref:Rubrerythrin diiron-binding domain-containing protein n=1 Tax=Enhygromyxa salina TaxID=215803 RepID=A0A0C1Z826_9BACT|nr:ferritin-like domain-containing protein [Enhygromyxa salina]KIG13774.1 hypothetical protein DB30_07620 [Enhygromyxa salina]